MRTSVYVDGFNLYYGSLKNSPYKWLDLLKLFQNLLKPNHEITQIKLFTARVKPTNHDPNVALRQKTYLTALKHTIPNLIIIDGHFLRHKVRMANANPPPNTVEVYKTEEKGSDVNLAVHLLNDAWCDHFDCAVVVSNDSDMSESMRLTKEFHPNKTLGLITPGNKTSWQLLQHADFTRKINRDSLLKASQLPDKIPNTNITKPKSWYLQPDP